MAVAELEGDAFRALYPDDYFAKYLLQGQRPDGRRLQDSRQALVSMDAVSTADASASVRLGGTFVLAGIRLHMGPCMASATSADADDLVGKGAIHVQVVENCLTSSRAGMRQLGELTHFLRGQLGDERALRLRDLSIVPGKHAWHIHLDVYFLNDDGGLFDACLLAGTAALSSLQVPEMQELSGGQVGPTGRSSLLALARTPLCLTVGIYKDDKLVCDPSRDEEAAIKTRMTVTVDSHDNLLGCMISGGTSCGLESVRSVVALAASRYKELAESVAMS